MTGASTQDRLRRLIEEADGLADDRLSAWKERARLALSAATGGDPDQLERFDQIRWSLGMWTDSTPPSAHQEARRRGLRRSAELLEAVLEDMEARESTPELPGLDPSAMHPWVADAAARLWQDGHKRQAVQAAATSVEGWLRARTGVHQGSIVSLAGSAFSAAEPSADSPRLRFPGFDPPGSDSWKSAHEGAGAFARGCFLRIRNLYTHQDSDTGQEDLEALAALSLLARWIEGAELLDAASSSA